MNKKIIAVITDALKDRVVVCEKELDHAIRLHFKGIPVDLILELLEKILRDPSEVYRDDKKKEQIFNFFYRVDEGPKFVVAVIKVTPDGAFFASMYPTGKNPRKKHKGYKRVKL